MSAADAEPSDCWDMSQLLTGRHVAQCQSSDMSEHSGNSKPWGHAPPHWTHEPGIYFVTASTLEHLPVFKGPEMLDFLKSTLLGCLTESGWKPQAWAVFPNHYHFVASHDRDSRPLSKVLGKVHMLTSKQANLRDATPGRKIWFNYRDTQLTFEKSWLARLAYVMANPVKHGLVTRPEQYRWCSAGWFAKNATRAFAKAAESFKTDLVSVDDPIWWIYRTAPTCRNFQTGRHVGQSKAGTCPRTPKARRSPTTTLP
jgi:putative transposase